VTYRLTPAESLSPDGIDHVRRIYEAGFAPHLRADFPELIGEREPGELAFALTADGQPRGFAMLRPLGPTGWIFLRYFVIDAGQRGRGLGGELWTLLTAQLRESGYSLLVFDVEDPAEPGTGQLEVAIRIRRIVFYQRHGASVLPVTGYRTPHGDAAESAWTPMLLLAAGLSDGAPPAASLRDVVEAVYRYRWSLAPDHPQVASTQLFRDPAIPGPNAGGA
jgi:GNAT superfamily N-acetyltransferase